MEIENTLMKKANGMFRWAACQLDSLGSCLNLPKLRKALAILPKTLNDTYTRIFANIDEEYQQHVLHILQWLAFSVRPLRLEDVSEVVAIDVNDTPQFDPLMQLPDPPDVASPLYYAPGARLLESVKMLLDNGADINPPGGNYGTALIAASSRG